MLNIKKNSVSHILSLLLLITLLVIPYFRGLFFEKDMYIAEFILNMIIIIGTIVLFRSKVIDAFSSVTLYPLIIFTAIYFISSLQHLTPQTAYDDFLRQFTYLLVFIGIMIFFQKESSKLVIYVIFLSVIWISAFGLFAHFGWVEYQDAILYNRISSVFQYPNTLSALIGAAIIGILMYALKSDSKWYIRSLFLTQLVPLLVVFTYTISRANYLIVPIVWFFALFFMKLSEQIRYILMTILLALFSLPIIIKYEQYLKEQNDQIITIIFIVGIAFAIVATVINILIEKFQKKFKPATLHIRFIVPIGLLLTLIFAITIITTTSLLTVLPDSLANRISRISLEDIGFTARATFIGDSFRLFLDHWLIGAGGKGWNTLYHSYQSYAYVSTQTHSYPMKILTDVGIIGTIAFVLFIVLLVVTFYRWVRKHGWHNEQLLNVGIPVMMAIMIFLHSLIDFDMSYGYVSIVWFALLAVIYIWIKDAEIKPFKISISLAKWTGIIVISLSLIFTVNVGMYAYASSLILEGDVGIEKALETVNTKISLSPSNVDYRLTKVQILDQAYDIVPDDAYKNELLEELVKIYKLDQNNPVTLMNVAKYFAKYGYGVNAQEYSRSALEKAPMLQVAYEQYLYYTNQLAIAYLREGHPNEAMRLLNEAVGKIEQLETKIDYIKTLPPAMQEGLTISDVIGLNAGKTFTLLGEYENAEAYLNPVLNTSKEEEKIEAILWLSINDQLRGNLERANELIMLGRQIDVNFDLTRDEFLALVEQLR